ncbi:hypothetical protein CTAYLR_010807 [Chrysophaeum taylorii]|uniref:TAZ-type domain-containing protein n=1 Tax=Chrysophaeum taylorii TaxID=2483200 RepID=A0AAD7XGQ2_9STRA|nr:hypothetical protein CTAYLR_010807 [Chrysophaeum taylorii]
MQAVDGVRCIYGRRKRMLEPDERLELVSRARVIARKVWYLRHGAACDGQCRLRPCPKAIELVTHMRSCGAFVSASRGCRAPACAHAARLLHHPRTRAGSTGKGLVLRKDLLGNEKEEEDEENSPPKRVRFEIPPPRSAAADGGAASLPSTCPPPHHWALSQPAATASEYAEALVVVKDADGFAVPAPRTKKRPGPPS